MDQTTTPAPAQPDPIAPPPSTPAPEPAAADTRSPLERMTYPQRKDWERTGKLPPSITGESDPANDDAPAVDAKNQPIVGDDGKPISVRQQRINAKIREGVERGIATERAERQRLEREIQALKARREPQQPPPQDAKPADPPAAPKEPVLDDFLDQPDPYMAYSRALARWEVRQELEQRDQLAQTRAQTEQQERSVMERITAHGAREAALKATVADYDDKTLSVRQQLDVRSPLTLQVLESPVSAQLILHLAEHPDDFQRIGALGMSNMPAAIRELGKLEAKLESPAAPVAPAAPPKKHVTSAPEPPTTLGTRSAEPADEEKAAVARGDVAAFLRKRDTDAVNARRTGIR